MTGKMGMRPVNPSPNYGVDLIRYALHLGTLKK